MSSAVSLKPICCIFSMFCCFNLDNSHIPSSALAAVTDSHARATIMIFFMCMYRIFNYKFSHAPKLYILIKLT